MNKLYFLAAVILIGAVSVFAQDWVESSDSGAAYNCELVSAIIEEYGDRPYARENGAVQTFAEFHAICAAADDADTQTASTDFKVTVNQNVNLREGAGTSFSRVGQAKAGEILEVVAEDGDWYEVKFERGTAFIAGWLTTRLPDVTLSANDEDLYLLPGTTCGVRHTTRRDRRTTIHPVLYGEASRRFEVDVYKPGAASPVPIYRSQYDSDTNGTYQRYSQWWGDGVYTFEVRSSGQTHRLGFVVDGTYTHFLAISCV